ncbi:MAG TPA: FAD-dependent oxidoreductase [Solirubrobacter sp.]|nr:FAD-dependent oxidoreductase [Solirubrobacter sp.]
MTPLRVLVAGGGVAALEAVLALRGLGRDHLAVELLAPSGEFVDRPSSVQAPFGGAPPPRVPLDGLGATLHRGALGAVDLARSEAVTTDGGRLPYDRLIVAVGARPVEGVPGAILFRGPASAGAVEGALAGASERVLFTLPAGAGWTLPLYELALLAAHEHPGGPEFVVVTPERRPLEIFGPAASDALARLLDRAGVRFIGESVAEHVLGGSLATADGRLLSADAVVALPRARGPFVAGLPSDEDGFLEVDEHCRVVDGVYAAGDATASPLKQGGLATQQADAAAEAIAAEAGAPVVPRRVRRVLRGIVLTGEAPLFLRRDLDEDAAVARTLRGAPPGVSRAQLWWPSGKLAGRYITGFLADRGSETLSDRPHRRPLPH